MTHPIPSRRLRHVRGLTLIEMMVSLAIGLVIVVAVLYAYMGSATAARMTEAQGRMNEDAQAALAILSQHLRMAGNNLDQPNRVEATRRNPVYAPYTQTTTVTLTAYSVRGCDRNFGNTTGAAALDDLTCAGTSTLPDSIAVNYEADRFNTIPTAAGNPTDCLGNTLPTWTENLTTIVGAATATTAVNYAVADNRFYVNTVGGTPSLYCKGNGAPTPQPLVENIEDLQFTYGTVPANATTSVANIAGYLSAGGVTSEPSLVAAYPLEEDRWRQVKAVRICLVVRSENPIVSDLASARYRRCDGTMETNPPDLRLRRAYTKTVVLRNRG